MVLARFLHSRFKNHSPLFPLGMNTFYHRDDKVLSFLEACFELILGSSLHMKIQIMDGKITENMPFKSEAESQKIFILFSFHFLIFHKNCISLFLTIFEYLVLQIR